jgi:hypothetical protein
MRRRAWKTHLASAQCVDSQDRLILGILGNVPSSVTLQENFLCLLQFDLGNLAMVTGGHNNGRVGTIVHKEKHRGGHDIVHIEDSSGNRWGQQAVG